MSEPFVFPSSAELKAKKFMSRVQERIARLDDKDPGRFTVEFKLEKPKEGDILPSYMATVTIRDRLLGGHMYGF